MNKGTEAMGYLQFIIDYFDRLPASIAFIHGGRCARWMAVILGCQDSPRLGSCADPRAVLRIQPSPAAC